MHEEKIGRSLTVLLGPKIYENRGNSNIEFHPVIATA